jgi:hypothetical protein
METITIRIVLAVIVMFLHVSCMDQDPFGQSSRDIKGAYELEQWEDGSTYYLKGPSPLKHQPWGAIEGTVGRIGWSGDTILVWQNNCGSGEGWRIIDTKKEEISSIVSQEKIDQDPKMKMITIFTAAEAWEKLD